MNGGVQNLYQNQANMMDLKDHFLNRKNMTKSLNVICWNQSTIKTSISVFVLSKATSNFITTDNHESKMPISIVNKPNVKLLLFLQYLTWFRDQGNADLQTSMFLLKCCILKFSHVKFKILTANTFTKTYIFIRWN